MFEDKNIKSVLANWAVLFSLRFLRLKIFYHFVVLICGNLRNLRIMVAVGLYPLTPQDRFDRENSIVTHLLTNRSSAECGKVASDSGGSGR